MGRQAMASLPLALIKLGSRAKKSRQPAIRLSALLMKVSITNGGTYMETDLTNSHVDAVSPDRDSMEDFIWDFKARSQLQEAPRSIELRLISFLRHDDLRRSFAGYLNPEDIAEDLARLAFLAIREANSSDLAIIESALNQSGLLDPDVQTDIMQAFATANVSLPEKDLAYCRRLLAKYIKSRKVMGHLSSLQGLDSHEIFFLKEDFFDRLQAVCMFDVAAGLNGDKTLYRFSTTEDFLRAREQSNPTGMTIPSSFGLVNEILPGGYAPGTVSMVVAPPGVGKSTFLAREAIAAAQNGHKVYMIVLGDLNPFDILARCVCIYLRISMDEFMRNPEKFHEAPRVRRLFENIQVRCVGAYELTIDEIYRDAISRKNSFDYDMILIDYDGNVKSREGTLYQEGGVIYGKMDQIAKHTGTVLITACQPKQEFWETAILTLKSAGESSKKQHVADLIVTLSRPTLVPVGTLHIPKARRGRSGQSRYVAYAGQYCRILEITSDEHIYVETLFRDAKSSDEAEKRFCQWVASKLGTDNGPGTKTKVDGGIVND